MKKATKYAVLSAAISLALAAFAWPVVSALDAKAIQPIASGVATIAGILLGCVIAAMTILVSSSHSSLIRNMKLTGGLSDLISNLNHTMLALVITCVIFLAVLFVPDQVTVCEVEVNSIVVAIGVVSMGMSFMLFLFSWGKFKQVASLM